MSAAHTVIPATAKSETSLALSLAKARDSLTEVSPLLKQVRDVLDSNVLKTVGVIRVVNYASFVNKTM